MGIIRLMFPSCKELAERLSSGRYEKASRLERLAVRWHLLRCELCDRYARQLEAIARGYRDELSRRAGAEDSLKKRLQDKLRAAGGS